MQGLFVTAYKSRFTTGYVHAPEMFRVFTTLFSSGLQTNAFRLPTLAECVEAEERLHLTIPDGSPNLKKKITQGKKAMASAGKVQLAGRTLTQKKKGGYEPNAFFSRRCWGFG